MTDLTPKQKAEVLLAKGWKTETGKIYGFTWFHPENPDEICFLEEAYEAELNYERECGPS